MNIKRIFKEDKEIANAILRRDERVTRDYLYRRCYPLFKSVYDNYYTDCECCKEFIDEIYVLILTPDKKTGECQLAKYRGESTLFSWLKSVCVFYCFGKYAKANRVKIESMDDISNIHKGSDRIIDNPTSIDFSNINSEDVQKILSLMPNKTYSELIKLRYADNLSNKEVAQVLGVTMDNYYNMHLRAKEQYDLCRRKEDRYA